MAGEADGADGYKADKAERQLHVAHHTNTYNMNAVLGC